MAVKVRFIHGAGTSFERRKRIGLVSLVYTSHKQRCSTRIGFGRVWYDLSSRSCLAGLNVLLHEAKCILFYRVLFPVRLGAFL